LTDYVLLDQADDAELSDRVWRLALVVNAMAVYLAIREFTSPNYIGIDLKDGESWEFLRDTVRDITIKYLTD
jgi:hypothetical protein